ncbi:L-lactate dehydrogenase [Klebsiella pneumoniae]|uniref:L-lactate dehydrogenase n=1 Tax=Klebsiella pneumoniae TaxID=573 RepID=A0A377TGJ7_KLEPN|nr:L-lactate dehydrogenase [Klebsiella pneumoniae]
MKGDITILADSGIRNGLDVVRMIALGADSVLLGRAYLYALATHGKQGVANLLNLIEKEMKVAMTLTGAKVSVKSAVIRWCRTPKRCRPSMR